MKFVVLLFVLGAAVACTKPNPATCCLDSADCAAAGFDEVRECAAGLACVNHECEVPKCSTTGCGAEQPVCNITTDVCEGCASSADCERFDTTPTCDTSNGACVECVVSADCTMTTKPICDGQACRGCQKDSECAAGACDDDGRCVPTDDVVYLDPAGVDSGSCTSTSACRTITYALTQTSASRSHIVLRMGGYAQPPTLIDTQSTLARPLSIHGGGATISLGSGETHVFDIRTGAKIRHLTIDASGAGGAMSISSVDPCHVEDVKIRNGYDGISTNAASLTARNVLIEDATYGIFVTGGQLSIDGAIIRRGTTAVTAGSASVVNLKNVLIYGTSDRAVDLPVASGVIDWTTVADSGMDNGTGPRAVLCGNLMTLRSSIVWVPGNSTRPAIQNCNVVSSIVGPNAAPGATNVDPKFVSASNNDYHLAPASPARDAVEIGPTNDFEGDPRPRGAKFDIGADEAP